MKETKNTSKVLPEKRDKIKEAEKDYRKMWEEIKPFIKKREIKRYSTAGQWKASSSDLQE